MTFVLTSMTNVPSYRTVYCTKWLSFEYHLKDHESSKVITLSESDIIIRYHNFIMNIMSIYFYQCSAATCMFTDTYWLQVDS